MFSVSGQSSTFFFVSRLIVRYVHWLVRCRNYSLCLRNCEHVANYVATGHWVSVQMNPDGIIFHYFQDYLHSTVRSLINQPPAPIRYLEDGPATATTVYSFVESTYNYKRVDYVLDHDEETCNLLVLGPTGAGKSHIINTIFNRQIVSSHASMRSVTKDVTFIRGDANLMTAKGLQKRGVILIDTVGFCDTELSNTQVLSIVEERVNASMRRIHLVIFVLPQRLERVHVICIKKMMKWLKYDVYPGNFFFIINKCDGLPVDTRDRLISETKSLLSLTAESLATKLPQDFSKKHLASSLDEPAVLVNLEGKLEESKTSKPVSGIPSIVTSAFLSSQLIEGPRGREQVKRSYADVSLAMLSLPEIPIDLRSSICTFL